MTKYYLGVHEYGEGHDAGVCLVDETGSIVTVLEAERFTKVKKLNPTVPHALLKELFRIVSPSDVWGLGIGQISHVYDSYKNKVRSSNGELDISDLRKHAATALANFAQVYRLADFFPNLQKVVEVRHHLAHVYSAYYPSPFEEALIISVDGNGDFPEAVVVGYGKGCDCSTLWSAGNMTSLGTLYRASGMKYIGLISPEGEGKIMGLAAYGRPVYADQLREHVVRFDPDRMTIDFHEPFGIVDTDTEIVERMEKVFGPAGHWPDYDPTRDLPQMYKDMAASVQQVVEDYLLFLVRVWTEKTGCRNLCLAGGVAMNSMANGAIMRSGLVDNLFVQPASSDNGLCIGAAYALLHSEHPSWRKQPGRFVLRHTYFGSESSDREIESALSHFGLPVQRVDNPSFWAAERLARSKIVGWFQGRMEYGARALGNRSILADPRNIAMKDIVNLKVKNREFWRPFAPAILCEEIGEWFESGRPEPFMSVVYRVRDGRKELIPAVIHTDDTARVQSVERRDNPRFYDLISTFRDLTGVPVVLNTSMNGKGEPIARTGAEAIKLFLTSEMDALIIGNYVVETKPEVFISPYQMRVQSLLWEIAGEKPFHVSYLNTAREFPDEKLSWVKSAVEAEGGLPLTDAVSRESVACLVVFLLGNYDDDTIHDGLIPQTVVNLNNTFPDAEIAVIELFENDIHLHVTGIEEISWPLKVTEPLQELKSGLNSIALHTPDYRFDLVAEYQAGKPVVLWPLGGTAKILLNGVPAGHLQEVADNLHCLVDKNEWAKTSFHGHKVISPKDFQRLLIQEEVMMDLIIASETYTMEILQQVISFRDRLNIYLLTRNLELFQLVIP